MEPIEASASEYFGAMVESYDSLIRRAVPRYDEMIERLITYLPDHPAPHVLELGCGTGNLTLAIASKYPNALLTLVDAAPEMLDVTRRRLEQAHPSIARRARFVRSRFEALDEPKASIDIATSCISLHHVHDKAALYDRIAHCLVPTGTLRFGDQLRGASEANHAINWQHWLEFCARPGNCAPSETQNLVDHAAAHDHYTPVGEHFRMLERAGFAAVDCVWRNWIWGIVTADRGP